MIKWSLIEFPELDSTQNLVRNLGAKGAPEGTIVVAGRQTAGRGRHGRTWASPEGGLYMSLLLRPPSSERIQTLTVAASLAVARGIEDATGLKVRLRWPNDVMVKHKKVAGVICESSYLGKELSFAAVGIGVNCNSRVAIPEPEGPATYLADELGRKIDISTLRQSILTAFGACYQEWLDGPDIMAAARSMTGTLGKNVVITTKSGETIEGIASAIDSTGGLRINRGSSNMTVQPEDVERLEEA